MILASQWYRLIAKEVYYQGSQNIIDLLDVSILQEQILGSILNIEDPQKSKKIEFIGGRNALLRIDRKVIHGKQIAFTLYLEPTPL